MDKTPKLYGDHPIFSEAVLSWVDSEPGVHLRLARWIGGDRGTIHVFNGRTEYIEKYADVISRFVEEGFSVTAHDWRGQGRSTRNDIHPQRCHIDDFGLFQRDVAAIMKACSDMPAPRRIFAHSMGGAITFRYLLSDNAIESVVFSAPMADIYIPKLLRPFQKLLLKRVRDKELEWNCVIGTRDEAYETYESFWRNLLTTEKAEYFKLSERLKSFPELAVGGPTYYWYFAARPEIEALKESIMPEIPMLVFLGTREKIVSPSAVRAFTERNQSARLISLKGAKHEVYIERAEVLNQMWSHIESFWFTR